MQNRYQVVIVGGGPVGVGLAVELGSRGISCLLVERRTGLQLIPKGQNLTQRTLEHFYFWGIVEELRNARLIPPEYPIGEITAYRNFTTEFWHASPGREIVRPYFFQANDRLPQYRTEAVLRRKLTELAAVETRFGWSAAHVEQDESGVRITIARQPESGTEEAGTGDRDAEIVIADYVVGCDGGNSLVRREIGIGQSGTDFDQLMMLTVFRSRELHERLNRYPLRSTYRIMHPDLKGFWRFFGRIDMGEGWFFHAPVPQGTVLDQFDIKGLLEEVTGFSLACEIDYVGLWDLRVSVADTYARGRAFIAGDAAHTHPPYGGYGLNNGLEDAVNLGWKLAARLQGWGGDALLRSYGEERAAVFRSVGEDLIAARIRAEAAFLARHSPERDGEEFERAWQTVDAESGARVRRYEPHYEGSPVVAGPPDGVSSAIGEHSFEARAGHHLAPQPLSSGRNVYQELGRGFSLLAFDVDDETVRRFEAAAATLGLALKILRDDFVGPRLQYGHRLVLVRPDQHVAWTGNLPPDDAKSLLALVSGRD